MKAKPGMYTLERNMQLCHGTRSCGQCIEELPNLAAGSMKISAWAVDHNAVKIHNIMNDCPAEALTLKIV